MTATEGEGAGAPWAPRWALGLMSGTSLDGVDAALIETNGEQVTAFGETSFLPYAPEDLEHLAPVMAEPALHREAVPGSPQAARLAKASRDVVRLHARAAADLLVRATDAGRPASALRDVLIGFHGQTLLHLPEERFTWQLGDGAALAVALARPVVWDFRSADVAAGGQGAPLAPFYHHALARRVAPDGPPLAFLNIGGVANVSWVDPRIADPAAPGAIVAFDTGPGNALINDWMLTRTGESLDRDGAVAARGLAEARAAGFGALDTNFVGDFLARPGPKSLDRNAFNTLPARLEGWSTEAGAAALTLFTARCVAAARAHLPSPPSRWLVCGGGRRNPVMMAALAEELDAPVNAIEAAGLDGDMLEAQAFAYLAVRSLRGLPLSAPAITGVPTPLTGGRLSR
ncbi:MAG: anhydro-N-acetylmuramic acid kinase [Pseudomonadota bacterium]